MTSISKGGAKVKQEVLTTLPNSLPKILVLILLKKKEKKRKKDFSIKHLIVKKKGEIMIKCMGGY